MRLYAIHGNRPIVAASPIVSQSRPSEGCQFLRPLWVVSGPSEAYQPNDRYRGLSGRQKRWDYEILKSPLARSGHNNVIQIAGKRGAFLGGITLVQPHIGGDPVFQQSN